MLGLTLAGFTASSVVGVAPVWFAVGGAVALTVPWLRADGVRAIAAIVRVAEPRLLAAVIVIGLVISWLSDHGLHSVVASVLPAGSGIGSLWLTALIAAVLANLVNNLPATLILVPVAGGLGLGPLLAVLVGVNVGPNLTYLGSVATLLWRRIVHPQPVAVTLREFTRAGVAAVVPSLIVVPVAVWAGVRLFA